MLTEVLENCERYLMQNNYASYDHFDALTNDLINRITKNKRILRRIAIQLVAKSPVDLHWLGMKKMIHTKTISDLLCYYSLEKGTENFEKVNDFFILLLNNKLENSFLWGLNFPYASRFIDADSSMPNLYNTANAGISICYSLPYLNQTNKEIAIKTINEIINSIESQLGYINEKFKGWYLYYPKQKHPVYNVNALMLYFLVFVKKLGLNDCIFLNQRIISLFNLLREEQQKNGSWYYSRSDSGKWIDGFHTGFILESLAFTYKEGFDDEKINTTLRLGWDFYIREMFTKDGYAKYYLNSKKYPIEAQNYAQTIQTLSNFNRWLGWDQTNLLKRTIEIAMENLYSKEGFFYYKKTKYLTYKNPFIRWSVTPMMLALKYSEQSKNK